MKFFVTGAAGFIGSTTVDRLLSAGHTVVGFDNMSTGHEEFLTDARKHKGFAFINGDLLEAGHLEESIRGCEVVMHFAANADVRFGSFHPTKDLHQNTIATANVLEAMRKNEIKRIAFTSTGSVYGEAQIIPTPEEAPFPVQTSLYAASKVAAEGFIQAYCEAFGFRGYIFRNVSVLGERYTHGHVYDFYKQLLEHPERLDVQGNGSQRKSYMHVEDCVDAMFCAMEAPTPKSVVYNLGTDEVATVNQSIGWICEHMKVSPERHYTGGDRGWIGDNPFILLECKRIRALGWKPKLSVREGIARTITYLDQNRWVFERGRRGPGE